MKKTQLFTVLIVLIYSSTIYAKKFDSKFFYFDAKKSDLKANEGLVLIHVKNHETIDRLVFEGTKDKIRFKKMPLGKNFAVVKVKAGHYFPFLVRFSSYYSYLDFRPDESDYKFEVKAGKINYPGSWISDLGRSGLSFYNMNNTATIHKKFNQELPELSEKYDFIYTGRYPDPYIDHLNRITAQKAALGIEKSRSNLAGLDMILTDFTESEVKVFNKIDGIESIEDKYPSMNAYYDWPANGISLLSPEGTHLARVTFKGVSEFIEVLNIKTNKSYVIYGGDILDNSTVRQLKWIDDNSLYVSINRPLYYTNFIANLDVSEEGAISSVDFLDLPKRGYLVDVLKNEPGYILFYNNPDTHRRSGVFKVNLATQNSVDSSLKKTFYYNKNFYGAQYWVTDNKGKLRFAVNINRDENAIEYWFLNDEPGSDWRMIKSFEKDEKSITPLALSGDNKSFFVITDQHSDTRGVYRYSTEDFTLQETLFEQADINVNSIIFDDETSQVVGVRHLVDGKVQATYLNNEIQWLNELQLKNPDLTLNLIQQNKRSNTALIYGSSYRSRGGHYLYQFESGELRKLFYTSPEYEKLEKGVLHTIKTTTADGLAIESYLMLPQNTESKVPLVVMPHGGPIGVRDDASNDATQHFFAKNGIATLKVNFRGSGGFGKKFKEMGQLEWGKKIEQDIHTVVQQTVQEYPVDNNKICAAGFSYGGYSALMLTILYPEYYQCAVSSAGVTDIPLLFTSSDSSHHKASVEKLKAYAGDPKQQLQDMMNRSPVYLANKATNPILLIHGFNDLRVSLEHSIRFKQIMKELEQPVELLVLANESHGLSHIESRMKHTEASLEFIQKELNLINVQNE